MDVRRNRWRLTDTAQRPALCPLLLLMGMQEAVVLLSFEVFLRCFWIGAVPHSGRCSDPYALNKHAIESTIQQGFRPANVIGELCPPLKCRALRIDENRPF